MTTEKYLQYRGDVKAIAGLAGTLAFVTAHPEGQPTAVFRLDADKLGLDADLLPCGAVAVLAAEDTLYVSGTDGRVYQLPAKGGKPKPLGQPLPEPPGRMALLSNNRLAVLCGKQVVVLSRKDGKVLQTLDLPEAGTALAADPTGHWLVAGTARGTVAVFEDEDKPEFLLSESQKLHEGAVTALLFEPEELRFLSAGADNKLLSTHARGKLEPEDRGRGASHADLVTALAWGPADRFYSSSRDKTVKAWPRGVATRPVTVKDGVGTVVDLAVVQIHNRPHLALACDDNTLRLFPLDPAGKPGELTRKVYDGDQWARHELEQDDPRRREEALKALAGWNDTASVERLAAQAGNDADHGLRLLAAQLLGDCGHPRAAKLLEGCLSYRDEAVRVAAFHGLRKHLGDADLHPLDLALKAEKPDVGRLAVAALEKLASRDDQALARLLDALDAKTLEVRQAALASLERVHDDDSPEADLIGLGSKHADLRRLALVRLFQRKLLHHPRVQAAVRWRTEDKNPDVRRTAFLVSLYTREKLAPLLRKRDAELNRQLTELESGEWAQAKEDRPKPAKAKPASDPADPRQIMAEHIARAAAALPEAVKEEMRKRGMDPDNPASIIDQLASQMDQLRQRLRRPEEPS